MLVIFWMLYKIVMKAKQKTIEGCNAGFVVEGIGKENCKCGNFCNLFMKME